MFHVKQNKNAIWLEKAGWSCYNAFQIDLGEAYGQNCSISKSKRRRR